MNHSATSWRRTSLAAALFLNSYASLSAVTYDFDNGVPAGVTLVGHAEVYDYGGYSKGFLSLTEALGNQNGGIRFLGPVASVNNLHFKAKVRLADGTYPPADGFSLTVSADLPPNATYGNPENGYQPNNKTPRFILAFDTYNNGAPDFIGLSVIVDGETVATHPLTVDELPWDWFDLEVELTRAGRVTVWLDGEPVIENVATDFAGVENAWVGLDARTGGSYSTHWFDNVELDLGEGQTGPASILPESELASATIAENTPHRFAVAPGGAGPFTYQWYRNGTPIEGATGRVLPLTGALAEAGSYTVTVTNAQGQATSSAATLTIRPDTTPAQLVSVEALGGSLNRVILTFNEPLDPASATAVANYDLNGLTVHSAVLSEDGRTVTLSTSQQQKGRTYQLALAGIKDRSAAGNPLTTSQSVTTIVSYAREVLEDTPTRYWRFEETEGTLAASEVTTGESNTDAEFQNGELDGTPTILGGDPGGHAVTLFRDYGYWLRPANSNSINAAGPYAKKTIELWFQPFSLPEWGTTGLEATAGLWEQGAETRNLGLYLWRNPDSPEEDTVSLVFHAFNNANDGPGAPFGRPKAPATYVEYPGIEVGQVYHVVGVFDGDPNDTNGELILYVNGREVGRTGGVGQLYAHTGDIQIGRGNGGIHTGQNGTWGNFDGIIDEVAHYPTALPLDRIQAHYYVGSGAEGTGPITLSEASDLKSKMVPEWQEVSFTVVPEGSGPFTYQWFRNGEPLPDQTQATLALAGAVSDAGSYTVRVANQTHEVTGGPAVLTVIPDTTTPVLVASSALAGGINRITLDFSEPLDPVTATALTTYSLPGLTVLSAELNAEGTRVVLTTSTQTPKATYTLTIAGLKDRSAAGNPLTTTVTIVPSGEYPEIVLAEGPVRYWRFEEQDVDENSGTAIATSLARGTAPDSALIATYKSWDDSLPYFGAPSLLASRPNDVAVALARESGQWASVPNHADVNNGVLAKRTIEVWFRASSVPEPGLVGSEAYAGIWEEGGLDRGLSLYLWRDPDNWEENEAELVFHAFNRLNDGAGSPWGVTATEPVFVRHTIRTGEVYHVVAVLDGSREDTSGQLILYVNGTEVGRADGAGTLYAHGSDVRIGQGNNRTHEDVTGDIGSFDGALDELAVYNTALSAARVLAHYQAGTGLGFPSTEPLPAPEITVHNEQVIITWSGPSTLQWTDNLASGQWQPLPHATSPYQEPLSPHGQRFYRLVK